MILAVTFVSLGFVVVRSTRATLMDQVDQQLLDTSSAAADRKDKPRPGPPPQQDYDFGSRSVAELVYEEDGTPCWIDGSGIAGNRDPLPKLPPIPSPEADALVGKFVNLPAVEGSINYRAYVTRGYQNRYVVTATAMNEVDQAVNRVMSMVVFGGLLALGVAMVACWWLIRRDMRPVDRMVDTAAAIAGGDLGRRVPDANPRSELGRLGGALNEMLVQIERGIDERAANEDRLRRFVADAAHELRTPLTSVRGYAELYRQGAFQDPEALAKAMSRIEAEGGRMARLIDDLLLLARLDRQVTLEKERIDMAELVDEAVDDFGVLEPERTVTTSVTQRAFVLGDRVRLRQIVDNLLTNARIHTPAGTPVHVAVEHDAEHVDVTVADEGPGIPAEDQGHVFERFWRADPSRVRRTGGTGLGLSIVASLVHAHGGTVRLQSAPGKGATFVVRLPLA